MNPEVLKELLYRMLDKIAMIDDQIMNLFEDEIHMHYDENGEVPLEAVYVDATVFDPKELEFMKKMIEEL